MSEEEIVSFKWYAFLWWQEEAKKIMSIIIEDIERVQREWVQKWPSMSGEVNQERPANLR